VTIRLNEPVVYFNGEIIPESRALVSFRDRSFRYGDAFDTAHLRTCDIDRSIAHCAGRAF
jgi:branched-subunit amino acid aminotransferase/4-amino-4-deoxychorismate lyase